MTPLQLRIARFSIVISLIVLAIKYGAYYVSHSSALLSDAIETILNVIAAIGTLGAVTIASHPADSNHPYGHGKAEYLWAVIEGTLVVLTAVGIFVIACYDLLHPNILKEPFFGVLLNAFAGIINFVWARLMISIGRRRHSQALASAGEHVQSDVWASLALVIGVSLIPLLHWLWLDPVLSMLVALNVLRTGFGMMRQSTKGLMDEAPDPELITNVKNVIAQSGAGALEAHDLRMRRVGALYFVEFHLVVVDTMSITQAHDICDKIETAIRDYLGDASIHIHVEPETVAREERDSGQTHRHVLTLS